jgi:hypothetical protein
MSIYNERRRLTADQSGEYRLALRFRVVEPPVFAGGDRCCRRVTGSDHGFYGSRCTCLTRTREKSLKETLRSINRLDSAMQIGQWMTLAAMQGQEPECIPPYRSNRTSLRQQIPVVSRPVETV